MSKEVNEIYVNCSEFTAFPEPDEVLFSEFEKDFLLPIGLIHLNESKSESVLVAAPKTTEDGEMCRGDNSRFGWCWVTYSKDGSKWKLDCKKEDFFPEYKGSNYVQRVRSAYSEMKSFFKENGFIVYRRAGEEELSTDPKRKECLFNLGGYASTYCNSFSNIKSYFPHELLESPDKESNDQEFKLFDEDGSEYRYLGTYTGYYYSEPITAQPIVFYCDKNKRVLTIFEYT
jgi:hypothetical protein